LCTISCNLPRPQAGPDAEKNAGQTTDCDRRWAGGPSSPLFYVESQCCRKTIGTNYSATIRCRFSPCKISTRNWGVDGGQSGRTHPHRASRRGGGAWDAFRPSWGVGARHLANDRLLSAPATSTALPVQNLRFALHRGPTTTWGTAYAAPSFVHRPAVADGGTRLTRRINTESNYGPHGAPKPLRGHQCAKKCCAGPGRRVSARIFGPPGDRLACGSAGLAARYVSGLPADQIPPRPARGRGEGGGTHRYAGFRCLARGFG